MAPGLPKIVLPAEAAGPVLVALGLLGGFLLLWGLFLAHRARRPKTPRPPKRTFEAGRHLARRRGARTLDQAMRALHEAPVGEVVRSREVAGGVEVVMRRRRAQSCAQAAGYVAGLFEGAWAQDVRIEHDACAGERGGECRYVVSRGGRAAGAAATRGSASAPRRSPPARPGAS